MGGGRGGVAGCEVNRCDMVLRQHEGADCSVLVDSIIWNVEFDI